MIKIQNIEFTKNARIIVISDIHGRIDILKKLLKKVNYQNEDYLILLGDFAQKGTYPLKTLRYIMELCNKPNVYALLGNCDHGNIKQFKEEYLDTEFTEMIDNSHSLLYDMYQNYLKETNDNKVYELKVLQQKLKTYYQKEILFLSDLPYMIESKDLLFVHAGIEKRKDYQNSFYRNVIMKKYFYDEGHLANKMVICGHLPVTIYNKNEFDDNIIIDEQKQIICIDGGLVVKDGGQLNALIINKESNKYIYNKAYEDGLEIVKTIKESKKVDYGKGACWPNFKIELLEKGKDFSKIRLIDTNDITYIKNEYINKDFNIAIDDCPASILEVPKGEKVGIINNKCSGYVLIKYQGKQGWIKKEVIGEKENEEN